MSFILLDPAARPVIGHRGNAAHAPENTLESFAQALAAGADAIELDVHLSADGHVVVHHDGVLGRTSDGSGAVAARSLAELRPLDAGARFTPDGGRTFPYRGRGVHIPTLDEVLDAFHDAAVVLEIKTPLAAAAARRVVEAHGAERRCVVDAFDARALDPFRGTSIAVGAARGDVARLIARAGVWRRVTALPYQALFVPTHHRGVPLPIRGMAAIARGAGCPLHVWTVNDPARATRLWAAGVAGIVSDDPAAIVRARGR
jgi:glycerophosphoryl diester phosphodiesterase